MASLDPGAEMFVDDIFEGWLSVPSMDSFFARPQMRSEHRQQLQARCSPTSNGASTNGSSLRERKGHTKSRLGCITCKRRKIKCQEEWPSCANCIKRGCTCRYPAIFNQAQHDRIVSEVTNSPRPFVSLSETPTMYTANDMRLFHHFLIAAHPCIPYEYEVVWTRAIPTLSHHYDYLMHSILALAGSHLSMFVDEPIGNMALLHRQKAISGLEEAFTRWPHKAEEAHVMLASSFLLAFQSGYMPDGFLDHILSLRGCALISQIILNNRLEGAFARDPNLHGITFPLKQNFPLLDQPLAGDALRSIASFSHFLDAQGAHEIERAIFAQLVVSIRPLLLPTCHLTQEEIDIPEAHQSGSVASTSTASSPFTVPSPNTQTQCPIFPEEPSPSYEDIVSLGPGGITNIPADHKLEPMRSFNALMSSLMILATWPQEEILHLFASTNQLGHIVLAHFCCIRFVVAPLSAPESAMREPVMATVEWCEKIVDTVEDDDKVKWTEYVQWPAKILRTMRCCINQKRVMVFGDMYDILVKDPGAFREGRMRRL